MFVKILSDRKPHEMKAEADGEVIFLLVREYICTYIYVSLTTYKSTKYCGFAREVERSFEVSTSHLDVAIIAPCGVLVPHRGFRMQFCPATIISFRSAARILAASHPPLLSHRRTLRCILGGVLGQHNRRPRFSPLRPLATFCIQALSFAHVVSTGFLS